MTPDITAQNTEIVFRTKHHPMVCQQEIPTAKVSANLVRSMEAAENLSQILTDLKFSCRTVISLRCLKELAQLTAFLQTFQTSEVDSYLPNSCRKLLMFIKIWILKWIIQGAKGMKFRVPIHCMQQQRSRIQSPQVWVRLKQSFVLATESCKI